MFASLLSADGARGQQHVRSGISVAELYCVWVLRSGYGVTWYSDRTRVFPFLEGVVTLMELSIGGRESRRQEFLFFIPWYGVANDSR